MCDHRLSRFDPCSCPLCLIRDDLACRLPEMDQPGSDQENLDSEASLSSESLLDEQQRTTYSSEPDGQYQGASGLSFLRPVPVTRLWVSDCAAGPLGWALPVFVVQVWTSDGDVGADVCSVNKAGWRNSSRVSVVFVCMWFGVWHRSMFAQFIF